MMTVEEEQELTSVVAVSRAARRTAAGKRRRGYVYLTVDQMVALLRVARRGLSRKSRAERAAVLQRASQPGRKP
jgi:hypothetical protein